MFKSRAVVRRNSSEVGSDEGDPYTHGFRLIVSMVALALSIFLVALDMTIVGTAIPTITQQFHSLDDIGWYGSAFFLTTAAFQFSWGKCYKYFPLKTVFLVALLIFELGSLICGVAHSSTTLIVGRAVAGVGAAGMSTGAYTAMGFLAAPDKRPVLLGCQGATFALAAVFGPLVGGQLTEKVSWRWCFYINLPIGGAVFLIFVLFFRTPKLSKPVEATWKEILVQVNPIGVFAILGAVVCYLLAMQWGGLTKPWHDSSVIGTLVGFGVIALSFLLLQYLMGEQALLPGRLIRQRTVAVACAFTFFNAGGYFTMLYYLPIYFQSIDGVSAGQSGVRNLPLILATTLCVLFSGGAVAKLGYFKAFMITGPALATVGAGLIFTLQLNTSEGEWIGYQILTGVGVGIAIQMPIISTQATVPASDLPMATATVLFFQTIGGAFFVSAAQSAFGNRLLAAVQNNAPSINPADVLAAGAVGFRDKFPDSAIRGILLSYLDGLHAAYAITIAAFGTAVFVALFSEWKKINVRDSMKAAGNANSSSLQVVEALPEKGQAEV